MSSSFFVTTQSPTQKHPYILIERKDNHSVHGDIFCHLETSFFVSFLLAILRQTVAKGNCLTCLTHKYPLIGSSKFNMNVVTLLHLYINE